MANSPVRNQSALDAADDVDPFKPSRALANSPGPGGEQSDDVDPFKPSRALSNSPTVDDAADPFKATKTLADSPTMARKSVSINDVVRTIPAEDGDGNADDVIAERNNNNSNDSKAEDEKKPKAQKYGLSFKS